MPDVKVHETEGGDYFVGFEVDGVFIPTGHVGAARVTQLKERAADLAELAKADDADSVARHKAAAESLPYSTKAASKSKSKSTSEGGAS